MGSGVGPDVAVPVDDLGVGLAVEIVVAYGVGTSRMEPEGNEE